MKSAIAATIDSAGRIVIPKPVRAAAGLEPNMPLSISVRDGRIEIEPAARTVKLVKRGGVRVAVPGTPSDALTAAEVTDTQKSLRGRHG